MAKEEAQKLYVEMQEYSLKFKKFSKYIGTEITGDPKTDIYSQKDYDHHMEFCKELLEDAKESFNRDESYDMDYILLLYNHMKNTYALAAATLAEYEPNGS